MRKRVGKKSMHVHKMTGRVLKNVLSGKGEPLRSIRSVSVEDDNGNECEIHFYHNDSDKMCVQVIAVDTNRRIFQGIWEFETINAAMGEPEKLSRIEGFAEVAKASGIVGTSLSKAIGALCPKPKAK